MNVVKGGWVVNKSISPIRSPKSLQFYNTYYYFKLQNILKVKYEYCSLSKCRAFNLKICTTATNCPNRPALYSPTITIQLSIDEN